MKKNVYSSWEWENQTSNQRFTRIELSLNIEKLKPQYYLMFFWMIFALGWTDLQGQGLVFRTDLLSHLRPIPTINVDVAYLLKNRQVEFYFGLEKGYASMDNNLIVGKFTPRNEKANLEYSIGIRSYVTNNKNRNKSLFIFSEGEYAALDYQFRQIQAELYSDGNWFFPSYKNFTTGITDVDHISFTRFQFTGGVGFHISSNSGFAIDFTIGHYRSYHSKIQRNYAGTEMASQREIRKVKGTTMGGLDILGTNDPYSLSEKVGASDNRIDADHKNKAFFQFGICMSWTFGSKVIPGTKPQDKSERKPKPKPKATDSYKWFK